MLRCKMETEMQHIFTTYKNVAGLVEQLMAKTQFWEQERNKTFYYDEVRPHELLTELSDLKSFIQILDFRTTTLIKYLDLNLTWHMIFILDRPRWPKHIIQLFTLHL